MSEQVPGQTPSASSAVGSTLAGRYVLAREIGRGGMGLVYEARDSVLHRAVAIKIIHESANDPEGLRRFEQEARSAGALSHPNVVTVFDTGREGQSPFIVTELLRGITLRERMERGSIAESEAIQIIAQLARGLAAAHAKGIVHRDLKPANLFLTEEGQLKILDFGVAKLLAPLDSSGGDPTTPGRGDPKTQTGRVLGTVGYMAPEQVKGQPVSDRADVFSAGLILFELISGTRPFQRSTPIASAYAVVNDPAPSLPATAMPALQSIAARCLRKNAEERPSAAELVRELSELSLPGAGTGAMPSLPTPTVPQRPLVVPLWQRPAMRRTSFALGVAAGVVVLAALLTWGALRFWLPAKSAEPARPAPRGVPIARRWRSRCSGCSPARWSRMARDASTRPRCARCRRTRPARRRRRWRSRASWARTS